MLYQSREKKFRSGANRSLMDSNIHSLQQFGHRKTEQTERRNWEKARTEKGHSYRVADSLQSFQQELNSLIKSTRKKKTAKRSPFLPSLKTQKSHDSTEISQLKSQVQGIRSMLEKREKKSIEEKLEKIIISIETQNQMRRIQTERSQLEYKNRLMVQQPQQPIVVPQPQFIYPPQPYYQPSHSYQRRKRSQHSRYRPSPESDEDQQLQYQKPRNKSNSKRKPSSTKKSNSRLRRKLRIIFLTVAATIFLQYEAKKKAAFRRKDLESFCKQKFYIETNNIKEWLLESQKTAFAIILEKKNLNFLFFNEPSSRVKQQKLNLVMQIVSIGLKQLVSITKPKKIEKFGEFLSKLCMNKSYPINNLWTNHEMGLVSLSQTYGFFKLDESLEKFLIGLLVFVKIFIFNMLLQPFKFDNHNFTKKSEPITTNLKLISSIYYLLIKEVLDEYLETKRSKTLYKIGNHRNAKMAQATPSEPLIYGKCLPRESEYISGLFNEVQLEELKEYKFWELCLQNLREIISKIHLELKTDKF